MDRARDLGARNELRLRANSRVVSHSWLDMGFIRPGASLRAPRNPACIMWRLVRAVETQCSDLRECMGRIKTRRFFVLTVVSVVVLSLVACGGVGQQSGNDAQGAGSSGEGSEDFSVTTLEGERFDLSEKQGEVVALYFMAGG